MSAVILTVEVEDWDDRTAERIVRMLDATADGLLCIDTVSNAEVRYEAEVES